MMCAYCERARGIHADHVVPRSIARRQARMLKPFPAHLLVTVRACYSCNILKGARLLVPPSWADRIDELNEAMPGAWRVWSGDVAEDAFTGTHK